jgi:hypothetical protein
MKTFGTGYNFQDSYIFVCLANERMIQYIIQILLAFIPSWLFRYFLWFSTEPHTNIVPPTMALDDYS